MEDMPKNFPEYLLMYKTLGKRIEELRNTIKNTNTEDGLEIKKKIQVYQNEMERIKNLFPMEFFDRYTGIE